MYGVGPMVQAGDLRDLVQGEVNRAWEEQSRHRREADEVLVRRRETEELAEYRRRHQEEMAQATPGWREHGTLPWKYRKEGRAPKRVRGVAPKGWRVEPHTKEVCPACGKEKVNREGWAAERSHDGHSSGPPTPVQPAGGVTGDLVRQVFRDVLPEVLHVGVRAVNRESGGVSVKYSLLSSHPSGS